MTNIFMAIYWLLLNYHSIHNAYTTLGFLLNYKSNNTKQCQQASKKQAAGLPSGERPMLRGEPQAWGLLLVLSCWSKPMTGLPPGGEPSKFCQCRRSEPGWHNHCRPRISRRSNKRRMFYTYSQNFTLTKRKMYAKPALFNEAVKNKEYIDKDCLKASLYINTCRLQRVQYVLFLKWHCRVTYFWI